MYDVYGLINTLYMCVYTYTCIRIPYTVKIYILVVYILMYTLLYECPQHISVYYILYSVVWVSLECDYSMRPI